MGYIKKIDEKEKDKTKVVGARVSEDVLTALALAEEDSEIFGFSISITDIIKQALNDSLMEIKKETNIDYYKWSKWIKKIRSTYLQVSIYADAGLSNKPFEDYSYLYEPNLSGKERINHFSGKAPHSEVRSLFKGKVPKDMPSIDLHGMKIEDACSNMSFFIQKFSDNKFIQIIHGKGYHSDEGLSVMKSQVVHYLKQHPKVDAFCSCTSNHGGTGALWVLLRESGIDFQLEEFSNELRRDMLEDIKNLGELEQCLMDREQQLYFGWNAALEKSNLMVDADGHIKPRPATFAGM
ncbi:Smr/MutS family protein [Candidatus Pseudothioglobus singularis]|jgi:DNA-nicking Smr family endonuclease|nr:Smr/MutS family protein [Candidatus Pseudothioglobus singularis]